MQNVKWRKSGAAVVRREAERPFFEPVRIQARLQVGSPDDAYEHEADAVADRVMRRPDNPIQRKCAECEQEDRLQRRPMAEEEEERVQTKPLLRQGEGGGGGFAAPAGLSANLNRGKGGGRPLPGGALAHMNHAFGVDFSGVRVHTGSQAAEMSHTIRARAFTHGADIYFNHGQYQPDSAEGRRLLAHELTHVVQQGGGPTGLLQREDAKPEGEAQPKERVDVALLLDDSTLAQTEAETYAPIVIRATSGADAKKQLQALGRPIRTLYVVSHSNRLGEVQVISGIGTISWVRLADFSKDLKGALPADEAPETVDFRGCKLGEAPAQMETFRQHISAQRARATNCWSFAATVTPLTAPDGTDITSPALIPKGMEKQFNAALLQQVNGLKSADGKRVKNCITGLAPNESADKNFKKIRELYFRNQGKLSAGWVSPEFNEDWQKGSMCAKDLTETTSPCKMVIKNKP